MAAVDMSALFSHGIMKTVYPTQQWLEQVFWEYTSIYTDSKSAISCLLFLTLKLERS